MAVLRSAAAPTYHLGGGAQVSLSMALEKYREGSEIRGCIAWDESVAAVCSPV